MFKNYKISTLLIVGSILVILVCASSDLIWQLPVFQSVTAGLDLS
jgi:hypothetical protein